MSKLKLPQPLVLLPLVLGGVLWGCGSGAGSGSQGTGGNAGSGTAGAGGVVGSGGTAGSGGTTVGAKGGSIVTGGTSAVGGNPAAGSQAGGSGGAVVSTAGGSSATGGVDPGGGSTARGSGGGGAGGGGTIASGGTSGTGGLAGGRATAGTAGSGGSAPGGASSSAGASAGDRDGGQAGGAGGVAGGDGGQAGSGGSAANVLESILVPVGGDSVASKMLLDAGELFLLKATGILDTGTDKLDAEYGGFAAGGAGQDMVGAIDVGVDVGFKVERPPAGTTAGRKKWFGAYRADHTYYLIVTGAGAAMSLKMVRPAGTTGTGGVTVSILRLSPSPPNLPGAIESLKAPVTNQTVHSVLTTDKSTVYLLQASGSGKCGGNNLALGDADWMDWDVNGAGKEDIGDNNVDYGLGVDEANTAQTPRLRWWGPWRKDHTYYMLFAGTGNSIAFYYYDSGYGDNSTTDKLTVEIFAVP